MISSIGKIFIFFLTIGRLVQEFKFEISHFKNILLLMKNNLLINFEFACEVIVAKDLRRGCLVLFYFFSFW